MNPAAIRPILPFRVHFQDPAIAPLDVQATTADDARKLAKERQPDCPINKIKLVRQRDDG